MSLRAQVSPVRAQSTCLNSILKIVSVAVAALVMSSPSFAGPPVIDLDNVSWRDDVRIGIEIEVFPKRLQYLVPYLKQGQELLKQGKTPLQAAEAIIANTSDTKPWGDNVTEGMRAFTPGRDGNDVVELRLNKDFQDPREALRGMYELLEIFQAKKLLTQDILLDDTTEGIEYHLHISFRGKNSRITPDLVKSRLYRLNRLYMLEYMALGPDRDAVLSVRLESYHDFKNWNITNRGQVRYFKDSTRSELRWHHTSPEQMFAKTAYYMNLSDAEFEKQVIEREREILKENPSIPGRIAAKRPDAFEHAFFSADVGPNLGQLIEGGSDRAKVLADLEPKLRQSNPQLWSKVTATLKRPRAEPASAEKLAASESSVLARQYAMIVKQGLANGKTLSEAAWKRLSDIRDILSQRGVFDEALDGQFGDGFKAAFESAIANEKNDSRLASVAGQLRDMQGISKKGDLLDVLIRNGGSSTQKILMKDILAKNSRAYAEEIQAIVEKTDDSEVLEIVLNDVIGDRPRAHRDLLRILLEKADASLLRKLNEGALEEPRALDIRWETLRQAGRIQDRAARVAFLEENFGSREMSACQAQLN